MKMIHRFATAGGTRPSARFARASLTALVVALLVFLAACSSGGGGGSGGGVTPPPPPVASLILKSATPANGATNVAVKGTAVVVVSYANTGTFIQTLDVKCNSLSVKTGIPADSLDIVKGELTYTVSYTAPYLSTCSISGNVTGKGQGGASDPAVVAVNNSFTTEAAPAWWPPTTITPMGVKVFGANQLPAGCNAWAQQCWKDAVQNGMVKFVATSALMTGYSPRPVVFAYFRNTTVLGGIVGQWNYLPIYADDGSLVGADIFGGVGSEIDWVYGTSTGIIVHERATGTCTELYWYQAGFTWSSRPATCPV